MNAGKRFSNFNCVAGSNLFIHMENMADLPIKTPREKPRRHDVEQEILYVDRVDDRSVRCRFQNCWKKFSQVKNCRQHIRNFHLCILSSNVPDSTSEGNF